MASSAGILAGRIALVTGGGSGIGKAICSVLAREGAAVAVVDINKTSAEETVAALPESSKHAAFSVDVSSSSEVGSLLQRVQEKFSLAPSIAIHAAGITKDRMFLKMDEKTFDDVISVNLKGTFLINQAVGKAMAEAKVEDGSIVNISSIVGKIGNIGQGNYAASKAGVIGMTKTAAKELAKYNIRVNAVLPGFVESPMTDKMPDDIKQMCVAVTPMMRIGTPEEVAEVCAFLASSRSSFVTGTAIEVSGGLGI